MYVGSGYSSTGIFIWPDKWLRSDLNLKQIMHTMRLLDLVP